MKRGLSAVVRVLPCSISLLGIVLGGCVSTERDAYLQARADYDRCLAEHEDDGEACAAQREALRDRERDYETASERTWSCDDRPLGPARSSVEPGPCQSKTWP